jgi:hypothetical protein
MRYSNAKEIVAMALVWALVLIVHDRLFSKHLFAPTPAAVAKFTHPQVTMWMNHVGCSGGLAHALQAISTLPWLSEPQVVEDVSKPCGRGLRVNVLDVAKADFMELRHTLRNVGVVPAEVESGGIPHFALRATVSQLMGCVPCVQAAREAMAPKKDPKMGSTFKWLDSAKVGEEEQTITAYVRYGYGADVGELIRTLDQAGFSPSSVRIMVGEKA